MGFTRAKRRDVAEPAIVEALRGAGAYVARVDGDGLFDLLVGFKGQTFLLEVKTPQKNGRARSRNHEGGRGELKPRQADFLDEWCGGPVAVVHTSEEALAAIGAA